MRYLLLILLLVFGCQEPVDCEGRTNGTATVDECGVCAGDNSTCHYKWKLLSQALMDSAIVNDNSNDVHTYTFLAYSNAILHGWDDSKTINFLNSAYNLIDLYGYGLGDAWDAFGDGSINDEYTNYTVTMTTYVGWPFINGYLAGAVEEDRLIDLVEALLQVPPADTIEVGECWSYSDNPNDAIGCVHNINIGVAYFLQEFMKLNLTDNDFASDIAEIIEREIISYIPEEINFLYWDGNTSQLTDQHHLAYQGWHMLNLDNEEANSIGNEILNYISSNRNQDISSLIGQLVALMYYDSEADLLYDIVINLLDGNQSNYSEFSYYTMSNPRVLAHYSLWAANYYKLLHDLEI